jgi:hypothetical protein
MVNGFTGIWTNDLLDWWLEWIAGYFGMILRF